MDHVVEFLKEFNLQSILSMIGIMWYFTRDIKEDVQELKKDVKDMKNEMHISNTRISRLGGSVYGKDCYNQTKE